MADHVVVCEHPLTGAASASSNRMVKVMHNEDGVWVLVPDESFSLDDRVTLSLYASQAHGETTLSSNASASSSSIDTNNNNENKRK